MYSSINIVADPGMNAMLVRKSHAPINGLLFDCSGVILSPHTHIHKHMFNIAQRKRERIK